MKYKTRNGALAIHTFLMDLYWTLMWGAMLYQLHYLLGRLI